MASIIPVFLILSAGLFTTVIGFDDCGIMKHIWVVCGYYSTDFCCGTCDDRYCCQDPKKRFTEEPEDCILKGLRSFVNMSNPSPSNDAESIAIITSVLGFGAITIVVILCWFNPGCFLYKKCRNPQSLTTQILPHPVQGGQSPPYQPLTNDLPNEEHLTPVGALKGQPCVLGPPPSYQDAATSGHLNTYDRGQAIYSIQPKARQLMSADYTSPQPAYNPFYVDAPPTTVHSVNTSY